MFDTPEKAPNTVLYYFRVHFWQEGKVVLHGEPGTISHKAEVLASARLLL